MVTVPEAMCLLHEQAILLPPCSLPLQQAGGLKLAANVYAPQDVPAFRQSAMDGYAFSYGDWKKYGHLQLSGEVQAGALRTEPLLQQQAVRIFTGAPIPEGADTVVMQERTSVTTQQLQIRDDRLPEGGNVRPMGSELTKGALALPAGTILTPAAIGLLATLGLTHATVIPRPRVRIIVTGNELQSPGAPLAYGQVYESNSWSLAAALEQLYIAEVQVQQVTDQFELVKDVFGTALEQVDLLLVTGGVSTGDYDYVARALDACGVQPLFHGVRQKPGKPLYAGKRGNTVVFGLPGNPSAVLTCFYMYVLPVIERQMGRSGFAMQQQCLPLTHSFAKPAGMTHFLKGVCNNGAVTLLTAQESYKLNTFALANCLVQFDAEVTLYMPGDKVIVHLLL